MNKPSLILIAGWAYTASALGGLAKQLAPDFDVTTTTAGELWSEQTSEQCSIYAASLVSMLKRYKIPPLVAGWSMGGMIAIEATTLYPELMNALVLMGAGSRFCEGPGFPCGAPEASVRAMARHVKKNRELTLRRFFEQAAAPASDDHRGAGQKIEAASLINDASLLHGLEYLQKFDAGPGLTRITVPTLALHGKKDCIVPWTAAQSLAERMPSCRCIFDEEAGHDLPVRKPEFAATAILDFWKSLKP